MKKRLRLLLLIILSLLTSHSFSNSTYSSFQDTIKKTSRQPVYTACRLVTPRPVIDGKLDDECWKKGNWAGNYHQFIPNEGDKPTYPTKFNIQYDDRNLYVAMRNYQYEKIVRMAGVRDEYVGDIAGITLDSYRDYRTGFEFSVTAWGQKIDVVLFNPFNFDVNWNPVWKVRTGLEDSAWVAEYEIPLSQLRYSNKPEQVWGMHTWRLLSRNSEESNWEIQSKTGPGVMFNFGELRGISGLKKSRRLEIMPFALGKIETTEHQEGNPFTRTGRIPGGNGGLDAKIGVSSNFTVDLTVNPDFGQVESDPSVMNLTAFETFYEEKRPFFLEGLTIFDYKFDDQILFYSRRIGHEPSITYQDDGVNFFKSPEKTAIISALKFSGTTSNGLSIGLIQSITASEFATMSDVAGNKTRLPVEPLTSYSIGRIQKGYNAGNTVIGGMFTSTNRAINNNSLDFLARNAYTGGFDMRHYWNDKEFYFETRLIGSFINGSTTAISRLQESSAHYYQRPGINYLHYDSTATTMSGYGGKFTIGKSSKGLWKYSTGLTWLSPGLELNDLGYMQTADEVNQENVITYEINKSVSIFNTIKVNLEQFNGWNFNGTFLGSGSHLAFGTDFKNNWRLEANLILHSAATDTRILRGGPDMRMPGGIMTFETVTSNQTKRVTGTITYQYVRRGNGSARSYEIAPGISVRPLSALKLSIAVNYAGNNDQLQYTDTKKTINGTRYILGTIDQKTLGLTFRADLNISPEFSVQYYASPFVSKGSYSDFKYITNPEANAFGGRFIEYPLTSALGDLVQLYENVDGQPCSISNPDFDFLQFRSNLVARWEYRLGSFIYLVWSSERTASLPDASLSFSKSYRQISKTFPKNVFLVKLNYWFNL